MSCTVDDCANAAARDGLCWGHYKRKTRGKPVHTPLDAVNGKSATRDSVRELALRYADADAEDDDAFKRIERNLFLTIESYVRRHTAEKIRRALEQRRANGEHVGRPPAPLDDNDLELVRIGELRVAEVARRVGVSARTIARRLGKK